MLQVVRRGRRLLHESEATRAEECAPLKDFLTIVWNRDAKCAMVENDRSSSELDKKPSADLDALVGIQHWDHLFLVCLADPHG